MICFGHKLSLCDPFTEDRKKVIDEDEQTTKNSNAISELLASFQIIKTQNIQKCLQQICINTMIRLGGGAPIMIHWNDNFVHYFELFLDRFWSVFRYFLGQYKKDFFSKITFPGYTTFFYY